MEEYKTEIADFKVGVFTQTDTICDCIRSAGMVVEKFDGIPSNATEADLKKLIDRCQAVIYFMPFTSEEPFVIDGICNQCGIPVLFPFIYGWGVVLTVCKPVENKRIDLISRDFTSIERIAAENAISYGQHVQAPYLWLERYICAEKDECNRAGEYLAAAMCTNIVYRLATGGNVRYFPKFYIASVEED